VDFSDLKAQVKDIGCTELRLDDPGYFEAVVVKDKLYALTSKLEGFFGPPARPAEENLPEKIKMWVKMFGGIITGQTLYFQEGQEGAVLAMLWPWQDGQHITVKIIKR